MPRPVYRVYPFGRFQVLHGYHFEEMPLSYLKISTGGSNIDVNFLPLILHGTGLGIPPVHALALCVRIPGSAYRGM